MNSRRNFLKIAGISLTASAINPVSSSAARLATGRDSLKVGILLPKSNEHPQYSASFYNGLKLGLNQGQSIGNFTTELVTEQIDYGFPRITLKKVEQLINGNNVNMLVGLINPDIAVHIGNSVKNAQVPTLIANAGENYLTKEAKENPFLFFNSLNLYQNSFFAGKYAVEKYGKNIAVVTALYDSGYDALFAFYKGVESASGTVSETYVKKQNDNGFIDNTLKSIKKKKPDSIFVLLNGNLADGFFRIVHLENVTIPLITTSFAADENRLMNLGTSADGIQNITAWTKNLDNSENRNFVSGYIKQYSGIPDQFSFLGYESGQIINDSFLKCRGDISGNNLTGAIRSCNLKSPGGNISVNANTGFVHKPVYLCKIKPAAFSVPENSMEKQMASVGDLDTAIVSLQKEFHSGWLNPYPFI